MGSRGTENLLQFLWFGLLAALEGGSKTRARLDHGRGGGGLGGLQIISSKVCLGQGLLHYEYLTMSL